MDNDIAVIEDKPVLRPGAGNMQWFGIRCVFEFFLDMFAERLELERRETSGNHKILSEIAHIPNIDDNDIFRLLFCLCLCGKEGMFERAVMCVLNIFQ